RAADAPGPRPGPGGQGAGAGRMNTRAKGTVMKVRWDDLRAEQRDSWKRGERTPAEDYLPQDTGEWQDPEQVLEVISQEVLRREERGEAPTLAEYQQRFPTLATQLEALFGVHHCSWSSPATLPSAPPAPATHPQSVGGYRLLRQL